MLLEKQGHKENDVVSLRLSSGEELIGKYISEDDNSIKLEKVLMLAMNQKGLGMVPYMITVHPENKINLNKNQIVVIAESDKEIASQYILQTTGIQPVASASFMK